MYKFIHILKWNGSYPTTWCPINAKGEIIPHIFGYVVSDEDAIGYTQVENWQKYFCYVMAEKRRYQMGILGGGYIGEPTGQFRRFSGVTAKIEYSTYCDMGCYDCGHEYEHADLIPSVVSGQFLCAEKPVALRQFPAGNSFFPNHFKLIEPR